MPAPFELRQLADLRRLGKAPAWPIFITDSWEFARRMRDLGALAIRPNEECDWTPLAGMDVILAFPDWPENTARMRAIRDARPRRLRLLEDGILSTMWFSPPVLA